MVPHTPGRPIRAAVTTAAATRIPCRAWRRATSLTMVQPVEPAEIPHQPNEPAGDADQQQHEDPVWFGAELPVDQPPDECRGEDRADEVPEEGKGATETNDWI